MGTARIGGRALVPPSENAVAGSYLAAERRRAGFLG